MRPDGSIETQVANTLTKKMPILRDMPWKEGNLPTGHRVTSVLGLPTPTWRKANQGLDPTKVETVQFDEACGMLEDASKIDVEVAKISGNPAAYRAQQDKVKTEAFGQELERAILYESAAAHPEKIHGLAPRYPATSGFTASSYVLKPGTNSGSNCESIWLINWDPDRLCGLFPKGTVGGLQFEDKGEQMVLDSNSKQFWAYVTKMIWRAGLCVEDYRYASRFQWDPDDSSGGFGDTGKQLYLTMQNMLATVYDLMPSARFYMSRTSLKKLTNQLAANDTHFLEYVEEPSHGFYEANASMGGKVPSFLGVPVRVTDSLVSESAIS